MNILQVSNAQKAGVVTINKGKAKKLLSINWRNAVSTSDAGRVYLIVVNNIIKKIGGSQSKGGIKATFSFYEGANTGRPSIRSFGIMHLMHDEILKGNEVTIHTIESEQVVAPVKGLMTTTDGLVSAFKEMESKCISDYLSVESVHPEWNFQESGRPWPKETQQAHAQLLSK